jgi:hypothetical protein
MQTEFQSATLFPEPTPAAEGLVCRTCGGQRFQTCWHTFRDGSRHIRVDCASCGRFQRYAPQEQSRYEPAQSVPLHGKSRNLPLDKCVWAGFIRPEGESDFLPVATAATLGRCWEALLTNHLEGDRLAIPIAPIPTTEAP